VGRKSNSLITIVFLSAWTVTCGFVQAQPPGPGPIHRKPEFQGARERWFSMSPEDRQVFRRNAERWMQMSAAERNVMRARENLHREEVKREAEAALRDAGLRLDQEKRQLFEQRYLQERRRMERALRQEVEAKRKQELPALNDRLKKEFQQSSPNTKSTSAPALSAAPKK
jgi:hypothetical protein